MKQRFELGLECKNKVIDNLLQDFEDAEFQYSLQYQTQMEIILRLLGMKLPILLTEHYKFIVLNSYNPIVQLSVDIHKSRFSNLRNWYSCRVKEMLEGDNAEKKQLKEEYQDQLNKLQNMYDDCKMKSDKRTEKLNLEFSSCKNELQTKVPQDLKNSTQRSCFIN